MTTGSFLGEFPVAAITDHKRDVAQHRSTLRPWRSEAWARSKALFFPEWLGEIHVPFPASRATHTPRVVVSFRLQSQQQLVTSFSRHVPLALACLPLSL